MPAWQGSLPEDDIWALAYYVQSVAAQKDTPLAMSTKKRLEDTDARYEKEEAAPARKAAAEKKAQEEAALRAKEAAEQAAKEAAAQEGGDAAPAPAGGAAPAAQPKQ